MTSRLFAMGKTNTVPNEMIHITPRYTMDLHSHWNKMVPFLKSFIFANLSNGAKLRSYTCWLINNTQSCCFLRQVSNHYIDNEDLVFLGHVEVGS
jgi:hypothetical protein